TGDTTDDTGAFRLFGLGPGTYYIAASLRAGPPDSDTLLGTVGAMTYYPGTADLTIAQPVVLGAGDDAVVAFQVVPVRSVRVTGVVIGANGTPSPDTNVH